MIAITGATGRTGRVIAEALLGAICAVNVRQVVRLNSLSAHEPCFIAKSGKGMVVAGCQEAASLDE